jgi:hypothetical protein
MIPTTPRAIAPRTIMPPLVEGRGRFGRRGR